MHILLIEDDAHLGASLSKGLLEEGFTTTWIKDGVVARELIFRHQWDIIIMDVMLPGLNGIQLCEMIRFKHIQTPVLMLSALGEADDKVAALDKGADDYMTKPFHFKELISRINALYRRSQNIQQTTSEILTCDTLVVDKAKNKITRGLTDVQLSAKEFFLLCCLLEEKDKVVSRTRILESVWNTNQDTYTNIIDVYISYLRNKIDLPNEKKLIKTIKGRGYMISDTE
ncbi:DNA-binding response regulator, OmpR family, contains REC and winged-helix (wHTH) domain [Pustulibacterium marinum]|uniref:DNA-binding response regulator, OmpR family, contains REC and winged-helix (WHTH) domain n=1 Tax=Pustulibacterium marinum TaxID=1224947 RepID=A0A1I7IRC3_9FLAO|nr:response regulator transcription factor [Pustulibacterium marinum]SFU75401.1 DNA-binding response regulator, OmpR family, contains REC and winged-helix (wHTH) domain [Pustulibacterium marinum]